MLKSWRRSGIPGSKNVEFETWASDDDIYIANPPRWPAINAPEVLRPSALGVAVAHGLRPLVIGPGGCTKPQNPQAGNFPVDSCIGEEVRRNWASFQYIVGNNLFTHAGLAAAYQSGFKVNMPADSVEVKGDWVKVTDLITWLGGGTSTAEIEEGLSYQRRQRSRRAGRICAGSVSLQLEADQQLGLVRL